MRKPIRQKAQKLSWRNVLDTEMLPFHAALLWIALRNSKRMFDALAAGKGDVKNTLAYVGGDPVCTAQKSWDLLRPLIFNGVIKVSATAFDYPTGETEFFNEVDDIKPMELRLEELSLDEQIVLEVILGPTTAWLRSTDIFIDGDICWRDIKIEKESLLRSFPSGVSETVSFKKSRAHVRESVVSVILELWPDGNVPDQARRDSAIRQRLAEKDLRDVVSPSTIQRAIGQLVKSRSFAPK